MARGVDERKHREWRERLARYERSHLTVTDFCEAEGVAAPSFYQWRRRLTGVTGRLGRRSRAQPAPAITRAFVPVQITGGMVVEIDLPNGARVRVPASDAGALDTAITAAGRLTTDASREALRC